MSAGMQILEKPEWISWEDVQGVLWAAHAKNRENGIIMRYPSLSGSEIKERIEGKGKMFVAMDGPTPVGTAAYVEKNAALWCGKGVYGYYCFASLLPSYQKKGIYPKLCEIREMELKKQGITRIMMDTHEDNKRELAVARKQGFIPVEYVVRKDHNSVLMVKWLDECPYSAIRCKLEFVVRKACRRIRFKLSGRK